ncbi:hypothetical protein [Lactiplantibacillus paraplantarum]|uniref:Lipoprotein n=1 Tax=Lactiplantibacillus paraplantarum TaxID=60520 RepID=A0AAD0TN26_9LACO|nr:hypothetical protein [Lactiplantibacillus paraplantarum]AYJ38160.1 hypothetical protein LP667_04660 [Lactiplantibacillus paraplantarum]GEO61005.1 hypothetical protein LPA07_13260 [Lactiplantibacillus paraplantarum]
MRKIIMVSSVLLGGLLLAGCGNSSASSKGSSSTVKSSSSSNIKITNSDISNLQDGTADSLTKSNYKKYASSLVNSYSRDSDDYHKKHISNSNTNPKKGDYQISVKNGLEMTYLSNLIDIPDQNIKGLKLFNTQYWLSSIDKISKSSLNQIVSGSDDTKPVFNSDNDTIKDGDAVVMVTVETDFKNTTDQTLSYDGLSGYAGGDYDFTTPDGKQFDREKVLYNDETADVDVQAGKTVEDKDMIIILATGKNLKAALNKIPNTYLQIKTAGAETKDYDQIDGTRTIKLNLKH